MSTAAGGTEREPALVPYLIVRDARQALEWYAAHLGARRRGEPYLMPDGRIGHAELAIGDSVLYLADEFPEQSYAAPRPGEPAAVSLTLTVEDVDAIFNRALDAGASLERVPTDNPYGRNAVIRDPFGHRWILSAAPATAVEPIRQGDFGYLSLWVPDAQRATAFFGDVLGWSYDPRSRQVQGQSLHHGIVQLDAAVEAAGALWHGQGHATLFLCFAVNDVRAAAERVRTAGGRTGEPVAEPYGVVANCVDDQGMPFALFQPPAGTQRPPANGLRHGDVSYITLEVQDAAKARAFYGSVLGWQFAAGRVADGWQVQDTAPMAGISGGHAQATGVPMYRVDDIHAGVARVRAAGGTASDPEEQPYGLSSVCTDPQGTRFLLGQH
jgi:predicted enzyme related to lactoylglutathione lyase